MALHWGVVMNRVSHCARVALLTAAAMTILLSAGAASAASAISLSALLQEGTSTSTPPLPPPTVQARVERKVRETTGGRPVLMPSDPPVVVEVDEIFVFPPDVEEEEATYTVTSSNPMVAVAEYRNPVVVTPVGPGTATITVTSQLGNNPPVSSSFVVTVAADPTPVPAIPLVGQGLLAAFLLGLGAWLRYRRR